MHYSRAAGYGFVLMLGDHLAHPVNLTGEVAVVRTVARAGCNQFRAVACIGSDSGQYHSALLHKIV